MAEDERRREHHTRMVVERSGDPAYAQRRVDPANGDITVTVPQDQASEVAAMFEELRAEFAEHFGRPPGPDDPLFFDRSADTPIPAGEAAFDDALDELIAATDEPMLRAQLLASKDVGFLLTESNMHMFSAHEVDEWDAARLRHLHS